MAAVEDIPTQLGALLGAEAPYLRTLIFSILGSWPRRGAKVASERRFLAFWGLGRGKEPKLFQNVNF